VTIFAAHDGATPEHHLVLCQGPCLVREDVLDLAQVLCDVEGSTLNGQISFFIVQVKVTVQEEYLPELYQLNGHIQGDRDQHLRGDRVPWCQKPSVVPAPGSHYRVAKAFCGKLKLAHRMDFFLEIESQ
jgi:hypothetical protein